MLTYTTYTDINIFLCYLYLHVVATKLGYPSAVSVQDKKDSKMRNVLLTLSALLLSSHVLAQSPIAAENASVKETINNAATQLCQAALVSRDAVKAKAKELGMSRKQLKQAYCNDMKLVDFARVNREDMRDWAIATVE